MVDADVVSCRLHALVLYLSQIQFWGWRHSKYMTDAEADFLSDKKKERGKATMAVRMAV